MHVKDGQLGLYPHCSTILLTVSFVLITTIKLIINNVSLRDKSWGLLSITSRKYGVIKVTK